MRIWFRYETPKYSFLSWLAVQNRLSTGDRMKSWGLGQMMNCSLCNNVEETHNHLFFECSYSSEVWKQTTSKLLNSTFTCDWDQIVALIVTNGSYTKYLIRFAFQTTLYHLWKERNNRRQGKAAQPTSILIKAIDKYVANRINSIRASGDHEYREMKLSTSKIAKVDVGVAMNNQNNVAMFLAEKVISSKAKETNFIFSPASINVVLTMLAATTEDKTLKSNIISVLKSSSVDELNAVFREISSLVLADGSESGGPKISAVNGVWMEQTLSVEPSMKDLFENFFRAVFAQVDFRNKAEEVRLEVNAWGSKHTNGLIKDILPPRSVNSETDIIYGNALYFKGAWEDKFNKSYTKDKEFHLLNGESVYVPFMSKSYSQQYMVEYDDFKVLRLPFRQSGDMNRQFSMYFYLPDAKNGLNNLMEKMASTPGFLDDHVPRWKDKVDEFRIPKFKIEFGFEASEAFQLKVPLYHKACVEINEDGAEAAAVTVSLVSTCCSNFVPEPKDFVADHPFLFLIREDKTGTVLFVGQIFDPSTKSSST